MSRSTAEISLPLLYLARHGETAWSLSGQHTGLTDLPLTARGERRSAAAATLAGIEIRRKFSRVRFNARIKRATRRVRARAEIDADLVEWDYGRYEGRTGRRNSRDQPGWELFRDGCPGGESLADVSRRAKHVIARVRAVDGNVLLFSSGHFLRVLAAVVWAKCGTRAVFLPSHRHGEHAGLRAQPRGARGAAVERRPACGKMNRGAGEQVSG